jgi:CDP-diacylglycerol---glycerol-3-phosphate 3-phosphatidyltransferase
MTPKKKPFPVLKVPKILRLKFIKRKRLSELQKHSLKDEISNIPNLITFSRMLLIPVILYFLNCGGPKGFFWAASFFIIAGITDGLDGYIARKTGKITILGKFLDPLADKVTTLSIMALLVYHHLIPTWLLILILSREFTVNGLRTIAVGEGVVISASQSGKKKTAFQFVGITFLLTHYPYYLIGTGIKLDYHKMGLYILYVSLIMSLFSAFEYFALFIEAVERKNRRQNKILEEAAKSAGIESTENKDDLQVVEEHTIEVEVDN